MDMNITWNDVPWTRYLKHTGCDPDQVNPGWVITHDGAELELATPAGQVRAELSGRLRHEIAAGTASAPAVGDFVAVRQGSVVQIDRVLPRKTVFQRKEAGQRTEAQVICANPDMAIIVTTAPALKENSDQNAGHQLDDFSLRRIERYLSTLDPGVEPVVVLNKCDLVDDPDSVRSYVAAELPGALVFALSALTGERLDPLRAVLGKDSVAVAVGSSGCGKSTLIARLAHADIEIGEIRPTDGRGRHTTTARRMYRIGGGGILVDTPGMREVQLWSDEQATGDAVSAAFPEIAELEELCRFNDCGHQHEPGCAVREAVEDGRVKPERLQSFLALVEETTVTAEMRRQRARERGRQIARLVRQYKKEGRR